MPPYESAEELRRRIRETRARPTLGDLGPSQRPDAGKPPDNTDSRKPKENRDALFGLIAIVVIAAVTAGVCTLTGGDEELVETAPSDLSDELHPDAYLWLSEYTGMWGDCEKMLNKVLESTGPSQQVQDDAFFAEGCMLLLKDIIDKAPADSWGVPDCREIRAARPEIADLRQLMREFQE
ncbi:MAG: hypothetical protein F4177_03525 [Chloroflexi bacterium]|nr:hypothetical protein [Chloroflexota bacterium]